MRVLQEAAHEKAEQLRAKALAEKDAARREAKEARAAIAGSRERLTGEIARLKSEIKSLEKDVSTLAEENRELGVRENELIAQVNEASGVVRELVGVTRIHAKDLQNLLSSSLQTAINQDDLGFLEEIGNTARFPRLEDIDRMNQLAAHQITGGGAVRIIDGPIVDRAGNSVSAKILAIGNFTAAYQLQERDRLFELFAVRAQAVRVVAPAVKETEKAACAFT